MSKMSTIVATCESHGVTDAVSNVFLSNKPLIDRWWVTNDFCVK